MDIKSPEKTILPLIEKANNGTISSCEARYLEGYLVTFLKFRKELSQDGENNMLSACALNE